MGTEPVRAYVTSVGWSETDDHGQRVFRVIVEYPDGPPPDLSPATVWQSRPVKVVEVRAASGETAHG